MTDKLDTRPFLDFFGYNVYEGDNILCMHDKLMRYKYFERDSALTLMVKQLRKSGWDVKILPYDREENPENERIVVTIHKVNGVITKDNPDWKP